MADLMRGQFEAAIVAMHVGTGMPQEDALTFLEVGSNGYTSVYTKAAWWAWQASRAAVVVELPSLREVIMGRRENEYDSGVNHGIEICRQAIDDHGLKVLP